MVCVCHVIRPYTYLVAVHRVLNALLEPLPGVFCWFHKGLLSDGVHVNKLGQYLLYRSYRGAILKVLATL